ncbi:S8 family serine peptidase [Hymenobacter terrenus]|uniref:S8 family serine peptidase n=1 Tax=Hymenobacter terrenus TaxID=1629124 RepID=UPI0018CF13EA|nr:S8 family serine peptidase [Hymenobacter terrenus]
MKNLLLPSIAGLLSLQTLSAQSLPTPSTPTKPSTGKLGRELQQLWQQQKQKTAQVGQKGASGAAASDSQLLITDGYVSIQASAEPGQAQELLSKLVALGLKEGAVLGPVVSGALPIEKLDQVNALPQVRFVKPTQKMPTKAGKVLTQGDNTQRSALARSTYKVNGAGVKVGIISDSYNFLGGAAQGVKDGELPGVGNPSGLVSPVEVLKEGTAGASDEGRAMAEIIHDVAPGAKLAFHAGFNTAPADFVKAIQALTKIGCKVIVDDVSLLEPFYQDGPVTQAINQAVAGGVTYVGAVGNYADLAYEKPFSTSNQPFRFGPAHDFNPDPNVVDTKQSIVVAAGATVSILLQWAQPFYSVTGNTSKAATSDLDIYLLNQQGQVVALSDATNIGGDPVEFIRYTNTTTSNQSYDLVIEKPNVTDATGNPAPNPAPTLFKYIILNGPGEAGILEYATKSATVYGKDNAPNSISAGASAFYNKTTAGVPLINNFSTLGGAKVLFDINGNSVSAPVRKKPEIVAPDGVNTSFFKSDIPEDTDTSPNFFGTSAAAPHVAGVVALMLNAAPTKTPAAIKAAIIGSAQDMDDPTTTTFDTGFDFRTGYGFLQADKAVAAVRPAQRASIASSKLSVAPNPAETQVQLAFTRDADADTEVEIYNTWGKLLQRQPVHVHAGENVLQLTPNLPGAGSYILRLADRPTENTHLLKP